MSTTKHENKNSNSNFTNVYPQQEDRLLISAIEKKGCQKWSDISLSLKWRTSKQCRERWKNKLDPKISTDPLKEEEILKLEKLLDKIGTHWAKIVKHFPNRSDLILKNYYYTKLRSNKKQKEKNQVEEVSPKQDTDKTKKKRRNTNPRKRCKKMKETHQDCKKKKKTCIKKLNNIRNQNVTKKIKVDRKNNKKNNNKIPIFTVNKEQKNPVFRNAKENAQKNVHMLNDGANGIKQKGDSFFVQEMQESEEIKIDNEEIINLDIFKLQNNTRSLLSYEQKKQNLSQFTTKQEESSLGTDVICEKNFREKLNKNDETKMKFLTDWGFSSIQEIDLYNFGLFFPTNSDLNDCSRFTYNDSTVLSGYFEDYDLINLDFEFPDRLFY
ncbi:myb protein-related [Anaeramoeba flamelloides]|uniref:Myb protein-related n=1 Tax=Anaeramoeba flamelloides TaxID=1746091 RepID=A0AAV7YEZ2_9EUKA|nr:myb protein-related [Anaeramoeba flamelloides]